MKDTIVLSPSFGVVDVSATELARHNRDRLLFDAKGVTTVGDIIDADSAKSVLKSLTLFSSEIEEQRVSAKAPALEVTRKVDALAKELKAAIDVEASRISRVLGAYEAEERRKQEDARRKAEAEIAAIEAEAKRKLAAEQAKAATIEEKEELYVAAVETTQAAVVQVRQAVVNAQAPKPVGQRLGGRPDFEVINIDELYAGNPAFCKIEPNRAAIVAVLKANPSIQIPGLRHWIDHKLSV